MRIYGTAIAANDVIYFGCFNGKLYGVDPLNGNIKWQFQTPSSLKNYSTIYDEKDKFKKDFQLYGSDMQLSERKIHSLGALLSTPIVEKEVIFFGSTDGYLYAVKLR